jgi:hypothetical protein
MSIFMRIVGICISLHITFFSFSCSDSSDLVNTPIADNIENIKLCNVTITKMNLNTDKYRDGSAIRHASITIFVSIQVHFRD